MSTRTNDTEKQSENAARLRDLDARELARVDGGAATALTANSAWWDFGNGGPGVVIVATPDHTR